MNPTIDIIIVNFRGVHDVIQSLEQLGAWPHGTVWLVDSTLVHWHEDV